MAAVALATSGLQDVSATDDQVIKTVVIMIAMEAEAAPLIQRLGLVHAPDVFSPTAPCRCYSGDFKGAPVHIVTNGTCKRFGVDNVGTVAAGLSTWLALETLKPVLLINAGTAGGFRSKGAGIGDVFISSHMRYHDRRIALPGFEEWGIGDHPALPTGQLRIDLGFKYGVVTTSNSLDHTEEDDHRMLRNDASVKDMEAAAVAWSCELHDTPHFSVKVVTDIVDGERPTADEFLENLSSAAHALQNAVPRILEYVVGKRLTQIQ